MENTNIWCSFRHDPESYYREVQIKAQLIGLMQPLRRLEKWQLSGKAVSTRFKDTRSGQLIDDEGDDSLEELVRRRRPTVRSLAASIPTSWDFLTAATAISCSSFSYIVTAKTS